MLLVRLAIALIPAIAKAPATPIAAPMPNMEAVPPPDPDADLAKPLMD
jgi:hypothetical protein